MESLTVGTKIDVGDVVSKATDLLRANPLIILIQVIPAIPSLVSDVYSSSAIFDPIAVVASIISAVLGLMASGAYAPVVKEAIRGQQLTIGEAFRQAYLRFWSLLGAAILVVLIVVVGLIALVVPGIIFATWYAYTAPAIMLENKGALDGMSASKAFGQDKKWSTFLLFLTFFLVYIVLGIVVGVLSLGGGGRVIQTLLGIPVSAWTSVVIAYTYITHGPSATVAAAPSPAAPAWQQPPPTPAPPPGMHAAAAIPAAEAPPARFCVFCGSRLTPDAKFCTNCGKPV